jgi:hypothetical protein
VGADAQVVLIANDPADPAIRSTQADVVVVDGRTDGARALASALTGTAILWIGSEAPPEAHHATAETDDLSGAVVKALLAARRAG